MTAQTDRRLTVLLWLGVATMVVVVVVSLISVPSILTGASNSEEVKKGNDLSSCRAQFAAAVSDAQASLIEAKARLDVNTNAALRAATVVPNRELLVKLVDQAPQLEHEVTEAIQVSAVKRAEYRDAIQRALDDPNGFVHDCKEKR